jgi:hypothetical protein
VFNPVTPGLKEGKKLPDKRLMPDPDLFEGSEFEKNVAGLSRLNRSARGKKSGWEPPAEFEEGIKQTNRIF